MFNCGIALIMLARWHNISMCMIFMFVNMFLTARALKRRLYLMRLLLYNFFETLGGRLEKKSSKSTKFGRIIFNHIIKHQSSFWFYVKHFLERRFYKDVRTSRLQR